MDGRHRIQSVDGSTLFKGRCAFPIAFRVPVPVDQQSDLPVSVRRQQGYRAPDSPADVRTDRIDVRNMPREVVDADHRKNHLQIPDRLRGEIKRQNPRNVPFPQNVRLIGKHDLQQAVSFNRLLPHRVQHVQRVPRQAQFRIGKKNRVNGGCPAPVAELPRSLKNGGRRGGGDPGTVVQRP